jgi:dGTPase
MPDIKSLGIRQRLEEKEELLSPFALKSRLSRGRERPEEPCPVRTAFQRDRDRIIHSNAFRRLKHKTQVFIAPTGDHYVTRLTHTLEVSQIARTLARALNLNEDLTEAISLGHDLGHTPFGHIGEEVLNRLYHGGFRHSEQSLRVVDKLEKNGQGLNLTWEVRDGILNHSKSRWDIFEPGYGESATLEGEVCQIADAIAYINHDIADAIRAGLISEDKLPPEAVLILGRSRAERINSMVCNIIENSWPAASERPTIKMSQDVQKMTNLLREFLFEKVYLPLQDSSESSIARDTTSMLYHYFAQHPEVLPSEYLTLEDPERGITDYIAGMTDQFALNLISTLK